MSYSVVITLAGLSALASSQSGGSPVAITQMAFGDGGGAAIVPDVSQTSLTNELHRRSIDGIKEDYDNAGRIIVESVLPVDIGGFWIREIGLFMQDGTMFAIASYPDVYKPTIEESAGRELYVKMIIAIGNTATIDLSVKNSVVLVTEAQLMAYHPIDEIVSHMSGVIVRTGKKITGVEFENGSASTISRAPNGKISEVQTTDGLTALKEIIDRVDGAISGYRRI